VLRSVQSRADAEQKIYCCRIHGYSRHGLCV